MSRLPKRRFGEFSGKKQTVCELLCQQSRDFAQELAQLRVSVQETRGCLTLASQSGEEGRPKVQIVGQTFNRSCNSSPHGDSH